MDLSSIVKSALEEDVGSGDITTEATVPEGSACRATVRQKAEGVTCGYAAFKEVYDQLGGLTEWHELVPEGEWHTEPVDLLELEGDTRAILTGERTALNLLQHLSGIATLTSRFVSAVEGTGVTVLDTRKTTPGLRQLEKDAVAAGGGTNHRMGLYDAVLIKDNHIEAAGGLAAAVAAAKEAAVDRPIEAECASEVELQAALRAGVDRVLLDNMTTEQIEAAVVAVDGRVPLEVSGGVTLENVREIAETGIDFISVGALTHSAPALDISLIIR